MYGGDGVLRGRGRRTGAHGRGTRDGRCMQLPSSICVHLQETNKQNN